MFEEQYLFGKFFLKKNWKSMRHKAYLSTLLYKNKMTHEMARAMSIIFEGGCLLRRSNFFYLKRITRAGITVNVTSLLELLKHLQYQ